MHPAIAALGITPTQFTADAHASSNSLPPAYTSAASIEQLMRARAAARERIVPRTAYAPALTPTRPLAIAFDEASETFTVGDEENVATAKVADLLDLLADLGATFKADEYRSLLIADQTTARALRTIAATCRKHHEAGLMLDWWMQRLDHPGTGATYVVPDLLRRRYVTGANVEDEAEWATWATWTQTPTTPVVAALLNLARLGVDGTTLPGLDSFRDDDVYAYTQARLKRRPSRSASPKESATTLLTCSQATERLESLLMEDPMLAERYARTGHLISGTLTTLTLNGKTATDLEVHVNGLLSRFRVGDEVELWNGGPSAAPANGITLQRGVIAEARIDPHGLHVRVNSLIPRTTRQCGDTLTVRPRHVDPMQQRTLIGHYNRRLFHADNTLMRRDAPAPTRRTVPLDVILAAADDE